MNIGVPALNLAAQLTEDMKTSMKAGDASRTGVIRLLRGALKNEEIKAGHTLTDTEALAVMVREAKQRRDSIDAYAAADRKDLVAIEQTELDVIKTYLPEPLTEAELMGIITHVVQQLGATDMKQMGAVIGEVIKQVGARADGGTVSRLVRQQLQ